ncbi:MAG TPA: polyisoprenoid-binding protein [Gallionellaceae bacterium]|nr:polyisoprenoid-binding protein [Gallionellaceae bacterium]
MTRLITLLLAGSFAIPAHAADTYTIDPTHTWPMFEVSHLGFSTQRGRFDKSSGKVVLDTVAGTGHIELVIDTTSINMGFEEWNKHMRGPDFFSTVYFPTMTFTSDKIVFDGGKPVTASGELTLLGETRPITLTISDFKCGTHPMLRKAMCGANIATTIKRSDFGMKRFIPMVGDEVKIFSPVEAYKD